MADFYIRSARSLDRVLRDECSVKAAAAAHSDAGRVLAILINSLAYRSALMHALDEARVLKLEDKVFNLTSPATKASGKVNGGEKGKTTGRDAPKSKGKANLGKREGREYPSKEAFLLVLCHDLLFQSRGIQAAKMWPPKVTLERYRPSLHSSLVKLQIRTGKSRIQELRTGALYQEMTARIPRWIRINTLRATASEVFAWLAENQYIRVEEGEELVGVKEYAVSKHVEGLLAFHPKATTALLGSKIYKENWIVMQDLASCFPAYILDPEVGEGEVLDATSAPGNKTSHLSAIMYTKSKELAGEGEGWGTLYAFERDPVRYKTLVKRLIAIGALSNPKLPSAAAPGNVIAERKDFLTTNPSDFGSVTHMLLDPSCSGSGIVNRLDFLKEDDDVEDSSFDPSDNAPLSVENSGQTKLERRLHQLSEFQLLMIRHAFKFPSLRKVVYSTCSIHAQENENVVIRALETDEAKEHGWRLAPRNQVIPSWPVRGDKEACKKMGREDVAEDVIRCLPGGVGSGDKPHVESCNGFFVACFVRGGSAQHGVAKVKRARDAEEEEEHRCVDEDGEPAEQLKNTGTRSNAANRKKKLQRRRKKQRLHQQ